MNTLEAPAFIIHAAGSLGNQSDLGKRPYRLRCEVVVPGGLRGDRLKRAVERCLDDFVRDMHVRGFDWVSGYGWKREGMPQPYVAPMTIRKPRRLAAREMLPSVAQGARFLANDETVAQTVPALEASERWRYVVSGVFTHDTILTDVPDRHEELR